MTKAVASAKTNGAGELRKCRSRRRERIGAEVAGDGDDDEGSGERKDQRHDGVEAGLQIWSFWVGWRERSRSRSFRAIPAEEVGMVWRYSCFTLMAEQRLWRMGVHAAVGVGARMLFYPTVVYNVVKSCFEPHFYWWDQVDMHVLLSAHPCPSNIMWLKKLGVYDVVTLSESYERLVCQAHGIENLVLPTRGYLHAPSFENLCQTVVSFTNLLKMGLIESKFFKFLGFMWNPLS
uniref:Uncharacterized protein n=1 Tax=Oryza barthii TaxID=65489 RepID=A0A0D3F4G6_9ORYZ